LPGVHVLLATDAKWLVDSVVAALDDGETSFTVCAEGREVAKQVAKRSASGGAFDIAIVDLQIGSMGGIAVTMDLRLDATSGTLPEIPVLVLLDRASDLHLARRSGADGWLIKPLDPIRIRRAVRTIAAGGTYTEGLPEPAAPPSGLDVDAAEAPAADGAESAGSEPIPAG
jgi:DNA-binding NarL/FixJ family response regulator